MENTQIYTVKISAQGQVTIPSSVRQKIGVKKGEYIRFYVADGELALTSKLPIEKYFGTMPGSRATDMSKEYRETFNRHGK